MTYNECSTFLALFSSCLTIEYMNHYQTKISQPTTRKSSSRRICRQASQSESREIGRPIIFFSVSYLAFLFSPKHQGCAFLSKTPTQLQLQRNLS